MANALDAVLQFKQLEQQRSQFLDQQRSQAIGQLVNTMIQKPQIEKNMQVQDAQIAKMKADAASPLNDILKAGQLMKVGQEVNNKDLYDRSKATLNELLGMSPAKAVNDNLNPVAQISQPARANVDTYLAAAGSGEGSAEETTAEDAPEAFINETDWRGQPTARSVQAKNEVALKQKKAEGEITQQAADKEFVQQAEFIKADLNEVFDVYNQIPKDLRGPVAGRTKGQIDKFLQSSEGGRLAQEYEDSISFFLSNVARSLGGERGVLTDRDIERIRKIMPTMRDEPELAESKIQRVNNFIQRRIDAKSKGVSLPGEPSQDAEINAFLDSLGVD